MTPDELLSELDQGAIRPAYLVAGPEALFRDDCRDAIRKTVLGEQADAFQFDRLDAANVAPAQLLDALKTLSMLGGRRYVELRGIEARRAGEHFGIVER